ncbi:hypothetical protein DXG03_005984 [Asterophora parasitica]|uniref:Uncharacterized protein n=1 Tax=Asterophora parasitica TaxID=117018 RepID=A0A9P7FZW4_9AGAR|nr:hypothetical protein DXG03_005984 [Asterophora parasitica]
MHTADELRRLDDAIWEEEVDVVQRVSEWLDQTGWLVTFAPRWHHVDGCMWLHIEAKNGFAQSGELSLPAIDISKLAPAASATPMPLSRPPTPPEVTPTAMEVGSSEERHNNGSGVVALAARVQDEDVEMMGPGPAGEIGGVVPGVEGGAIALGMDSGMTDADWGLAGNTGTMAESAAMETLQMLPSSWQELARMDARVKAAGNMVASSSESGHQPQTLVGVVIDQKHTMTHKIGETGVGPAADKYHQMNAFGVDRKSTGEVEAKVVSPATKAKGHACRPKVATRKVLSNAVVEDSESDRGVELVLGPSKVADMVDLAASSFLAPNREKDVLQATSALSCQAANAHGDLWALKALYATLRLWEKEALTHVREMEAVLGQFTDLVESERDEGMSRRGGPSAMVGKGKAWAETEELSEEEEMASRDEEYDMELGE